MAGPEDVLSFWLDEAGVDKWYVQDDALDAVSGAITQQPERLPRPESVKGGHSWMASAKTHKAKEGRFDV